MRQITITCAGNSTVADSYFAGYQGEHNATQLSWELSEDLQNYNYILAFALPDGNTESVVIDEYPIVYSLSQTITQLAGVINVQLTVLNDDEIIYKTQQVQLRIASSVSIDNTAKPYVSELTEAIEKFIAATKSLSKITVTGERKDSSVDISITDQNGNTEVFSIFDGSDYVLTDNDKQEIATVVTGDLSNKLDSKQDKLIAGENIKTVNGQSLLGQGNVNISGKEEFKSVSVVTEEEVNQIYLKTDLFDICYISIKTNTADCKFKISYYCNDAPTNYKNYAYAVQVTAQYGLYCKIEKYISTLVYGYHAFCMHTGSNRSMMNAYYSTETKTGIVLTATSTVNFPVGTVVEVYYK